MIDPERRHALLSAIRGGQSLKDAAAAVGIPRSSLYLERSRNADFARELDAARRAAAAPPEPAPEPDDLRSKSEQADRFVASLGSRKKRLLAAFLLRLRDEPDDDPTPEDMAHAAVKAWLAGEDWIDPDLREDLLRRESPRAADDFVRWRLVREAERLANGDDAAE